MATFRLPALLCLLVFAASGCAWFQPPAESQAIIEPYRVTGVSKKSTLGKLMLTESGLWAFVHARSAKSAPEFTKGEVVAFMPHNAQGASHLYGVVLARSWGVLLQRLDLQKVGVDDAGGELVPVGTGAQLRRWGICRGEGGDIAANACLKEAPPGSAWRIFRTDANARITVASEWGMTPAIRTDGLVQGGRAVVRDEATNGGWLAIPASSGSPRAAHARVLLEPDCPDMDVSQSLQPIEVLRGEVTSSDHPVDIEAAAIESGADVLVRCTEKSVTVAAPTLFRPLLSVDGSSARGLAFGAMRPITVARSDGSGQDGSDQLDSTSQSIIFLAAGLSTGSVLAADFYLEQALISAPDGDLARRLAVDFMQVPAAAGRPEAALRAGREASRGAWHRQNSASFVLGSAWVLAALGQTRAHVETMSRVQKLANAPESDEIRLWLTWTQLRDGLGASSNRGKNTALSYYEEQELSKWLEAAELLVGWTNSSTYSLAGSTSGVHKAFEPSSSGCDRTSCKLDVYGRNFGSLVAAIGGDDPRPLIDELNTLGVAAVRPGFRLSAIDSTKLTSAQSAALRAAAMPLLPPQARAKGFEALAAEVARGWQDQGTCLELDASELIVGRIESRRLEEQGDGALAATSWLLATGLPAACESPTAFVASLEKGLGRYPKLSTHAAPLFEALVSQADDDERSMLLRQFADFTAEHEKGAACKRWNLALAVSRGKAGRLTEAESDLSRAINCEARGESAYTETEQLLIAYLRFEKSASISEDLSPDVRERLAALVRRKSGSSKICLGLLSLDYKLEQYVHPDVAALAVAMPEPPKDDLELETSSTTTSRGIASLIVARRLLGEARPVQAARALLDARRAFARIGHTVGLRRVSFLEAVIFDGDLEAFLAQDKPRAGARVDLERPADLTRAQWAQALRAGKAHQVVGAARNGSASSTATALEAGLAASLVVESEEQSVEMWRYGSSTTSFDVLCGSER
jgi:hypothetical protein